MLFTRCPACDALYELSSAELAEAAGVVRCSNCGKTFNSLANLFDHQPEADDLPLRGQGMPPLLVHRILVQPNLPGLDQPPPDPAQTSSHAVDPDALQTGDEGPLAVPQPSRSTGWRVAVAALALLAFGQLLWLLDLPDRWLDPSASTPVAMTPDRAIVLVGRDLHAHPSVPDAVVISAVLRNQSSTRIDFPTIELRLFDRSNQILGVRRLRPDEYLPDPARAPNGLEPASLLPFMVEVAVSGSEPAGFEFRFF